MLTNDKNNSHRWSLVFLCVAVFILITVFVTQLFNGDKLGKYSGVQYIVASNALTHATSPYRDTLIKSDYFTIKEVRPTTKDEKDKYCSDPNALPSDDSSKQGFYTVVISKKSFYNPFYKEIQTYDGCMLERFDPPKDIVR